MKKNLFLLMVATLTITLFAACGDDEKEKDIIGNTNGNTNSNIDSRIVGTWTETTGEGWSWDNNGQLRSHWRSLSTTVERRYVVVNGVETGEYHDYTHEPDWSTVTFNADGTFIGHNSEDESYSGTYTTSGGYLTYFVSEGADRWAYSFEDNKLKLVSEEYEDSVLTEREISWCVQGAYQVGM